MPAFKSVWAWTAVFALTIAVQSSAHAQFGVQLPKSDFTWNWGEQREISSAKKFPDFTLKGGEAGFNCDLDGKMRLGSNYSLGDIRQIEDEITTSPYFIEASASIMNVLDQQRDLEWATLACTKPKKTEAETAKQAEKQQESLQKLHDKAVRKLIKRREKRERAEAGQQEDDSAQ
ncbi:MAG TPA: hypothetical protein VFY39_01535 [Gammaproteobacteria bacterium]|nr:hypothetical protein [Gammaproteobacteria bacterium]